MLFTSPQFIVLALITFGVYYLPALRRWQVVVLIAASLTFYAYNQLNLLWLLLLSVTINSIASYGVVYGPPASQKLLATLGVVANLAIYVSSNIVHYWLTAHCKTSTLVISWKQS